MKNFICVQSGYIADTNDINSFFDRLDSWGSVNDSNSNVYTVLAHRFNVC